MEKRKPHCPLNRVHALIDEGKVRRTTSAAMSGAAMGVTALADMVAVVQSLTVADFDKSMTSYLDHTIWHDVYKPVTPYGALYLKLIVIDDVLIVSFKEL